MAYSSHCRYAADMLSAIFRGTARHHIVIVAGGFAISAAWLWICHTRQPNWYRMMILVAAFIVVLFLAIMFVRQPLPEVFDIDPAARAFRTPIVAVTIYAAAAMMLAGAEFAAEQIYVFGGPFFDSVIAVVWLIYAVAVVSAVIRSRRVLLRPSGLLIMSAFGTVDVPWDAIAADCPPVMPAKARGIPLSFDRPELVRARGLVLTRSWVPTPYIHVGLLAAAIRYYAAHPEHRPAIGTRPEHDRLLLAVRPPAEIAQA